MSALASAPRAQSASSDKIRVMVVDDAVVVRGLLTRWLGEEPDIEVIGSARNGKLALDALDRLDPHVIILDIEMPEMDGLTALPLLLKKKPNVSIVMASTLTHRNADISLRALGLGARDYIPKPEGNHGVTTSKEFRRELVEKVRVLGAKAAGLPLSPKAAAMRPIPATNSPKARKAPSVVRVPNAVKPPLRRQNPALPRILAIGSSTGGPQALMTVFERLGPHVTQVPVVLAQHMPQSFTAILAQHLGRTSGRPSKEGEDGEALKPGTLYVAPGGKHMIVDDGPSGPVIRLTDDAPVNFCKPAVDPLFESVSRIFRGAALAVVLTGMGADGAKGAKTIADAGGNVIAQDEASSVVWGMPGATVEIGAPFAVLPVDQIGNKIASVLKGKRT